MGGRSLTRLQGAEWGRRDPTPHLPFPYSVREALFLPPCGDVREGKMWRKLQHWGEPPHTPAGKALTLALILGPRSHPCGDSPCPLTVCACSGCQRCFLPWCIGAMSSNPTWESRAWRRRIDTCKGLGQGCLVQCTGVFVLMQGWHWALRCQQLVSILFLFLSPALPTAEAFSVAGPSTALLEL